MKRCENSNGFFLMHITYHSKLDMAATLSLRWNPLFNNLTLLPSSARCPQTRHRFALCSRSRFLSLPTMAVLLLPLLLNFLQLLQQGHSNSLIFQMYVLFIEMDKGDVPIWKEYFQLWNMQRASYMEYVYYAYVTTICFRKYVVTLCCPPCIYIYIY